MKIPAEASLIRTPQRLTKILPFVVAIIVLAYLSWSIILVWVCPDDGVRNLTPTGYISSIDINGPSANILKVGDIVISVDDILLSESSPFYVNKKVGDHVHYLVNRDGQLNSYTIILEEPSINERMQRIMPLLVSLIFWIVSIGVQAYAPVKEATRLLIWLFLAISSLIASGQIYNVGPAWTANLYNFLAWMIGPIAVHFHLHFPQSAKFHGRNLLLFILYCIGLIGGLSYVLFGSSVVRSSIFFPLSLSVSRLLLTASLLGVIALLINAYRNAESPGVKAKIRIVMLGGVISIFPMITFVFLPELLFHRPLQSYGFVLSWVGILPFTYGYTIFRYHLIEIERHVNRGATYLLVFSVLVIFYLFLSYALESLIPISIENQTFFDMLLVMILASIIVPIYSRVQKIVDIVFYGGWYDYRSAITEITSGIEQITDLKTLAQSLSYRLVKTLRLEDTCVFLCNQHGDFAVVEVAPQDRISETDRVQLPVLPRSSLQFLLKIGREEKTSISRALSEVKLSPEEHQLLNSEQVHLWVPIIGHEQVKGFLALGPKYGGDIFSAEDIDILRIIARQVAPVIENIHLLTEMRQYAEELEKRVKERTEELYDAKERVEAILSSVGDGVFVTNLEGILLTVNKTLEDQSGYHENELIGKSFDIFLADDNDPAIVKEIWQTLPKGEVWTGELINQKQNNSKYDIHLTIAPVRDQLGKIVGYVGSQRDITRQKELDRLKDIFVADVSHELRTPTTNINLYLELLENASPEKGSVYLNVLKEQGLLLRKLVEDILDLSRLTIGKTKKSDFSAVDINLLTEQVVTAHQPLAQVSGISMDFHPTQNIPFALGEYNQLSRVLTNLVSNAIQYSKGGNIWIKTFFDQDEVGFSVEDEGLGIEQEDLEHIFERFYRGKQVRQSRIHGTGLGLAIVKEIVDLHNGIIQVESRIGSGSKFVIRLPIYISELTPVPVIP